MKLQQKEKLKSLYVDWIVMEPDAFLHIRLLINDN